MTTKRQPALVTFGLGGHTVYFMPEAFAGGATARSRLEGYDNPERFLEDMHKREESYAGVPVVDAREAYASAKGVRLALDCPLCDPGAETPERFRDICEASSGLMLGALAQGGGEQRGMAGLAAIALGDDAYVGLDSVPVPVYLAWHREHSVPHGALLGVISDDETAIHWEAAR